MLQNLKQRLPLLCAVVLVKYVVQIRAQSALMEQYHGLQLGAIGGSSFAVHVHIHLPHKPLH